MATFQGPPGNTNGIDDEHLEACIPVESFRWEEEDSKWNGKRSAYMLGRERGHDENTMKTVLQWQCDACQDKYFDDYEKAISHEVLCRKFRQQQELRFQRERKVLIMSPDYTENQDFQNTKKPNSKITKEGLAEGRDDWDCQDAMAPMARFSGESHSGKQIRDKDMIVALENLQAMELQLALTNAKTRLSMYFNHYQRMASTPSRGLRVSSLCHPAQPPSNPMDTQQHKQSQKYDGRSPALVPSTTVPRRQEEKPQRNIPGDSDENNITLLCSILKAICIDDKASCPTREASYH